MTRLAFAPVIPVSLLTALALVALLLIGFRRRPTVVSS